MMCLFPTLEAAMAFDGEIDRRRIRIPNRPDVYGYQMVMDGEDEVIGIEPDLLSNATTVTVDEAPALAEKYGGVCYPAHIDREANGIIATLGMMPIGVHYPTVELHDGSQEDAYREQYDLAGSRVVVGSDAHCLWEVAEAEHWLDIPDEPYSSALVRKNLIEILRRGL
jgi:hypothetical protein